MKHEKIIAIKKRPDKTKARRKGVLRPRLFIDELDRRRIHNTFEYINTRTIHYQTYRARTGLPYFYFNGHTDLLIVSPGFGNLFYAFVWVGHQAEDNLYNPATVSYSFTFDGTTYTWGISGTPGGDFSGSTSFPSPSNPPAIIDSNFNAAVTVVGQMFADIQDTSGTATIEPLWGNKTVTLTYRAVRTSGSTGHWDDDGHPGVSVFGNNIQGETTFYGGAGFDPDIHGSPTPDYWTTQIQSEADALIALLEAEPHIRSVSESDISITFTSPL